MPGQGENLWKRAREGGKCTGPHVYLAAPKIWCRLKRFSGTKCHNWGIWFQLKRFPRTTGQKTVTTCVENVLARTPKLVVPDFSIYKTSPGGGGASGGSLRSSRQAVACHPFTRSWATMPPEAPPPPGLLLSRGFSRWSFPRYAARESGFGEKITPYFFYNYRF